MNRLSWLNADGDDAFPELLWEDGERRFCRLSRCGPDGTSQPCIAVVLTADHPTPDTVSRVAHEYELKDHLDGAWAMRPLELVRDRGQTVLMLEYHDGEPLDRLIGQPMEIGRFLRLAVAVARALARLHERGLVHKDIKPANILVDASDRVWLLGFGVATRLPRERQAPDPPEFIAGTLSHMAPEQTGRINRSIDSRSDLYALGITLYQMVTGSLPFTASDPMEWVHCHIARKPTGPSVRVRNVPSQVSAIIMRLLAKVPEERYQTAAGVERDLRRCLHDWKTEAAVNEFPLGERDCPDRLLIPERLYGREDEIAALLAAFKDVVTSGAPRLVLVSGDPGIGKSSVVSELHKVLVPPRGLFASGKCDQLKRDIPYAALVQAAQSLVRRLLARPETELSAWRHDLRHALDPNATLITELIPEMKFIIGEQPAVPDLSPSDAKARFQLALRRLIGVFARPEHPLALFLDDLQWIDTATLDLLEDVLVQSDPQHLLLLGAYRDNEVEAAHPLMRKLSAIGESGAKVQKIVLTPLKQEDLTQLIADAFHCEAQHATPLAQMVRDKTAGNPFFANQFIQALVDEGLIAFDPGTAEWSWELSQIQVKGYTTNVVDLMVGKLSRLPLATQNALKELACLGNMAETPVLAIVHGTSEEETHSDLWDALRSELIVRSGNSLRFVHDRVQEAAYSLIPEELRAVAHLRIGRLLAAQQDKRDEAIFEIVGQLNRGSALMTSQDERDQLAELNLTAGKRARAAAAYASALNYLATGASLMASDSWERRHDLIFRLELQRAECEFLIGELTAAAERLGMLRSRAADTVGRSLVACLGIDVYTTLGESDRAISICLEYLQCLGVEWPIHPTEEQARREYEQIWSQIESHPIGDLIELPLMHDPASLATMDVLAKVVPPALFTDANLLSLAVCQMIHLSLQHGNTDASCFAYVWFGLIAGPQFGNYQAGFQLGRVGYELVEKRGLKRFQAATYMCFGHGVMPWVDNFRTCCNMMRRTFAAASKIGDLTFAGYSCNALITDLLAAGEELSEVQREAERGLEFARKARFGLVTDVITAQLALIRTLRGVTPRFGSLDDGQFDERRFEHHLASVPALALPECWYWIRKLQARFFAGEYSSAVEAAGHAQRLLWTSPSLFETAEYHFYGALSRAALCDSASVEQRQEHLDALAGHLSQLTIWSKNCPENFATRTALVGAERARIEERDWEAMQLYEQAIRSARENGFVHNEGLATDLAARFYAARGFAKIATAYTRDALHCYRQWGADGKVRQLDERYPLRDEYAGSDPTRTLLTPVEHLDLAIVTKVLQTISRETDLEQLIATVMRIAIEQAGADRGLLILPRDDAYRIEAEAQISGDSVTVDLRRAIVSPVDLPDSVFNYVLRTRDNVLLHDASAQTPFSDDPYICDRHARSVLCMPLIKQTRLVGVIYLENNLTSGVFTSGRMALLKLLGSEAAISLENAVLYRGLQEREARVRRLVDSNIIGIVIWHSDGRIFDTNDAFLRLIGYSREELVSGHVGWIDLTPPEWHDRDARALAEVKELGALQGYEKELIKKDGTHVSVLVGAATFDETPDEGVAFVIDLTERKRAEQAALESERESRLIVDTIPGLVAILTPAGEVDVINKQLLEYCGQPLEEMRRWGTNGTVHSEDLPHVFEVFTQAITSGVAYNFEARIRRFDGVYRWFQIRGLPLRDMSGQIARWYVLLSDVDDRKRAEDAVRASERGLKLIIDTIPALAWSARPDGSAEFFNQHYLDFTGLSAEQASGWGWTAAVHPEDLNELAATWQSIMASEAAGEAEARLRRYDGAYRWFLFRTNLLRDETGTIVKWYGVNTDIEDQRRAEEALRKSERHFRLLAETIPALVWRGTPEGDLDYLNQRAVEYLGHTAQSLAGGRWLELVHPDHRDATLRRWLHSASTGTSYEDVYQLRRADGEYRWIQSVGEPFYDTESRIAHWYGLVIDIEDRKRAEIELRRAYDSFSDAQRLSKTGSFITDLVGDDHNWSEETYRIFEFQPETEVTLQRIQALIHSDDRPSFESMIARAMSGENVTFAFRIVTPSAAVKHVRGVAHVIEKVEGRPMFIGALQDVTESVVAEEALNRARSELAHVARVATVSALTASIAHEVNQPLSGIITNAGTCLRMLDADPPNVEGARETARRTIRDGHRASEVITRLRALFSKREFTLESLDLNEAILEVLALSRSDLQRNRVVLQSELANDLPSITGDRIQLQQVILNLLRNASEAMVDVHDRPRQLLIRTDRKDDDRVHVSVQDAGVGIDAQTMDKLFDAFYTTKSDGMGIGLSISRSIVERHRGRLWAEPNDGPGATFRLSIPCNAEGVAIDTA